MQQRFSKNLPRNLPILAGVTLRNHSIFILETVKISNQDFANILGCVGMCLVCVCVCVCVCVEGSVGVCVRVPVQGPYK